VQLLPRDEKFFGLLVEQAQIGPDASHFLAEGRNGDGAQPDFRETARKVRDLELKGDDAPRKI
jgi:hypothetical protein